MKHKSFWAVITAVVSCLVTLLFFQNCTKHYSNYESSFSTSNMMSSMNTLQYESQSIDRPGLIATQFGFFGDGMEGNGNGNYIAETSRVANFHMVNGLFEGTLVGKVKEAKKNGNKVMFMVEGLTYKWPATGRTVEINPDYISNYKNLYDLLKEHNLLDTVLGFYVFDEPYWINSENKVSPLSQQQVFDNLQKAAIALKKQFGSQVIIALSEAYLTLKNLNNFPGFPSEFNWLAMNCYLEYVGECDTDESYTYYTDLFQAQLKSGQQQIMMLDNFWNRQPTEEMQQRTIQRTKLQETLAAKYQSPAIISFLYQSVLEGSENLNGLNRMPKAKDYVFGLALSITKKNQSQLPQPIPPVADNGKPPSALRLCTDWESQQELYCIQNVEHGRIRGCLPPGYNDPKLWNKEADGSFTHLTGRSCFRTLPGCANWEADQKLYCVNNVEFGRVSGCLPPKHDDPRFWVTESDGSFTHMTGRSCGQPVAEPKKVGCIDWENQQERYCVNGVEHGRITGCLPPGYNDRNLWNAHSDGSFTHMTGRSCL